MKSTLDRLEGLNRKLNIEVPAETVSQAFQQMYEEIRKTANIKGFRKGKAPLSAIKGMYSDRVKQDVLQRLVSDSYSKALDEHSLDPIAQPHIHVVDYTENGDFTYTAEMEVRPEVELKKIEGLKVEKELLEIDEGKIDETLKNIQTNFKEFTPVFEDRPAQKGDFLKIDFDGYINGEPLQGGQANGHMLELGSNSFIPGFEEGLEGSKPGQDRELELTFPIDYHVDDLKGQKVLFKVKIHEISKQVLPELNDELAQKVSPQFKTMDELKKAIREDFEKNEARRISDDFKNRLLKVLTKENPVEAPASLKADQKQRLVADVEMRLKQQGLDENGINEYKDKWQSDLEETADFMVQSSFLIDKIAETHDLRPTTDDLNQKMEEMSQEMNFEVAKIKEYYNEPKNKQNLLFQVMEEKVVSFLADKAQIVEVKKEQLADQN